MKRLAATICKALEVTEHCAVDGQELARVWPSDGVTRQRLVEQFATEHGWTVYHYKDGFGAIFAKSATSLPAPLIDHIYSHRTVITKAWLRALSSSLRVYHPGEYPRASAH